MVSAARSADNDFEDFYRCNSKRLMAYALRRTGSGALAEDVASRTMEIAWRKFDSCPEGGEFGWLCAIAGHVQRNQSRQNARWLGRLRRLARGRPENRSHASLDSEHLLTYQQEAVNDALAQLSSQDREILLLVAWDGLTNTELSRTLGTTEIAARKRLSRARARLRQEYDRRIDQEDEDEAPARRIR